MSSRPSANLDPKNPTSPLSIPSSQTALVLMDYLNLIVSMTGSSGAAATSTAARLRGWALSNGMTVFHCLIDVHKDPPMTSRLSESWPEMKANFAKTPSLADEAVELTPKGDDDRETTVVRPPGPASVLRSAGMAEALRAKGIKSLILAGISTGGCVLGTARQAVDDGFVVTIVADACCDRTDEAHKRLLEHAFGAAHIVTGPELLQAWGRR